MQKLLNPSEILNAISLKERLTGQRLIRAFKALRKVTATRLPQGFDDSDDISSLLLSLTDDDRTKFELALPAPLRRPTRPAPPSREPSCQIHVHAILCANDDGSGGASDPNAVDANYITQLLNTTNGIYQDTGIHFVYDPATDFELVRNSLLNLDFTVPFDLDFSRPESKSPLSDVDTLEGGQSNWRWCNNCQGLFFAGHNPGRCPVGGGHDFAGSVDFSLIHNMPGEGQTNWRWCNKCQGLFFAGNNLGQCPAGGQHNLAGSGDYCLAHNAPGHGQNNWRWCSKCQGLFFADYNLGACPAGGEHDWTGSGDYSLMTQIQRLEKPHIDERQRIGRQHRHKMVLLFCDGNELIYHQIQKRWTIIPRTYAFSGGDREFVALPTGKGDLQGFANLVAHETGHYFHQPHPHRDFEFPDKWRLPKDLNEAAELIKDYVENGNNPVAQGLSVFDGDGYQSTPPDAGPDLFQNVHGAGGDCGPNGEINIPVTFSDGSEEAYSLKPDRGNVMSYFKHCLSINMHFSQEQIAGIRKSIKDKNRWHLCNPSMRLRNLGAYVISNNSFYIAVWNPSEEPEIQVYDWPQEDLRAKYDELWLQGWRLKLLSPYVINGEVRYAAAWKPSTEGEIQVYDWPQKDLRAKYDELWPQGWRLKLLSPYVVSRQVRYAAVWKSSTEGEIQVYDWPQEDLRTKYDELWPQGWRLKLLSPYVANGEVRYAAVWGPSTEGEIQVYDWQYNDVRALYDRMW